MLSETRSYEDKGKELKGYIAFDETIVGRRPAVLVAHAWKGQDAFARKKAESLAELGYVGFAADLYGDGIVVNSNEEALALMRPLFLDRKLLQERIQAAYKTIKNHPLVDPQKMGVIGFCFGGLTAIELFRSGVDLRGAVSFHAVLGNELDGVQAKAVPIKENIQGSLLILHGHDDPLVSAQDIEAIQKELTQAKVDWQMHIYGHTSHAFTVPTANDPKMGLFFNPKANERSWQSMKNFFNEVFQIKSV